MRIESMLYALTVQIVFRLNRNEICSNGTSSIGIKIKENIGLNCTFIPATKLVGRNRGIPISAVHAAQRKSSKLSEVREDSIPVIPLKFIKVSWTQHG